MPRLPHQRCTCEGFDFSERVDLGNEIWLPWPERGLGIDSTPWPQLVSRGALALKPPQISSRLCDSLRPWFLQSCCPRGEPIVAGGTTRGENHERGRGPERRWCQGRGLAAQTWTHGCGGAARCLEGAATCFPDIGMAAARTGTGRFSRFWQRKHWSKGSHGLGQTNLSKESAPDPLRLLLLRLVARSKHRRARSSAAALAFLLSSAVAAAASHAP